MGIGDWVMATGQVKRMHAASGQTVCVINRRGEPVRHEVFDNNPKISGARVNSQILANHGGKRPYIDYANSTPTKWVWKKWDIEPGEIFLTQQEKAFAAPYAGRILVEPNTKIAGGNKAWNFARWQAFVDSFGVGSNWIQVGAPESRRLWNVEFVETGFRQAAAILAASRAFVGTEGALHHVAAAFGVPAVVLYSEFVSPDITGYPSQINIRHAGAPCGQRVHCASCHRSMAAIGVEEVSTALRGVM